MSLSIKDCYSVVFEILYLSMVFLSVFSDFELYVVFTPKIDPEVGKNSELIFLEMPGPLAFCDSKTKHQVTNLQNVKATKRLVTKLQGIQNVNPNIEIYSILNIDSILNIVIYSEIRQHHLDT